MVGGPGATIEDLIPHEALVRIIDRLERRPETILSGTLCPDAPFAPEVEA